LCLSLANFSGEEKIFDATLSMQRHPIEAGTLSRLLWRYPIMTMKVCAAIYWQALRLWVKRMPFYSHPPSTASFTNE
jgi:DUF1365 family protein